jgi:hypothetical protein
MKRLTTEQFIENFTNRYPDQLGLDMSLFEYQTALLKSKVICKTHDIEYLAKPDNLYHGVKGCLSCKKDAIRKAQVFTQEEFISRAKKVHGDYYDYSKVVYLNSTSKVIIVCPKHGEFKQSPQGHYLAGRCCPKCGYKSLKTSQTEWINKASQVHYNKYSYNNVDYINNYTPVSVTCPMHGDFSVMPKTHTIEQRGCPECYRGNASYKEIAWLDYLGIPFSQRQVKFKVDNKLYLADAKVDNIVYEFWGDFWHGNPKLYAADQINGVCSKTFGELYQATQQKRLNIINAGYTLIEIWESDWSDLNLSH